MKTVICIINLLCVKGFIKPPISKIRKNYKFVNTQIHSANPFADPEKDLMIINQFMNGICINSLGFNMLLNSRQKSLNIEGLIHSSILGTTLYTFLNYQGYSLYLLYLLLDSFLIKNLIKQKEIVRISQENKKGAKFIWGSASVGMFFAILTFLYPTLSDLFKFAYVSSISTKLSHDFREIHTNTLASIVVSFLISFSAYYLDLIHSYVAVFIIILSSQISTIFDSYIRVIYENNKQNNELLNIINIFIGASISIILFKFLSL